MEKKGGNSKLRVVAFIVAIVIAIFSFTYALSNVFKDRGPEWVTVDLTTIETTQGDKVYPYYGEVKLDYYPYGDRQQRNKVINDVKEEFNYILAQYFMLFDANRNYMVDENEVHNIKYINDHPNEDIVVHPFLFNSLKDAYEHTTTTDGIYNVFGGELYDYWVGLLDFDLYLKDPHNNVEKRSELESIVSAINSLQDNNFDLQFNETNKSVKFVLNENYVDKDLIKIDLQLLGHAYAIDGIRGYLMAKDYTQGYLYSPYYGYYATLGNNPVEGYGGIWGEHIYYPIAIESTAIDLVDISITKSYVGSRISDYHVSSSYAIKSDESLEVYDIVRHPFYNAKTGYPVNNYRLVSLFSTTKTVADCAYITLEMYNRDMTYHNNQMLLDGDDKNYYISLINEGEIKVDVDNLKVYANEYLKDNSHFSVIEELEVDVVFVE